jgi:hypothetical protein
MSQFDNTPIMPSSSSATGPAAWVQTWIKALTKPGEQTFIEIIAGPEATQKTAFIWVFIAGTITAIVQAVIRTISLATGLAPSIPGLEKYMPSGSSSTGIGNLVGSLVGGICAAPVAGLMAIVFFALLVAIVQWIAKLFGGTGSFEKLAYAFAAISVPVSLISIIFSFISIIPYIGICGGLFSILFSLYALYLQITATKAVNGFGWGQAAGSLLIPFAVIFLFCCCIVGIGLAILGPVIGNVFNQIQPGLTP